MLTVFWEIPIQPLTTEEIRACIEKLDFRDYDAYLKRIEGSVHITILEDAYCLEGIEIEVEPAYYKMKALFEDNNIHMKQTGIRDIVYSEMIRTPINIATFAQKNSLRPANIIQMDIEGAKVSFSAIGVYASWRGRIDVEAMKAKAMAII